LVDSPVEGPLASSFEFPPVQGILIGHDQKTSGPTKGSLVGC
jgi:hypothetical protein